MLSAEEKVEIALDLFCISDSYRYIRNYLDNDFAIDQEKVSELTSFGGIHRLLLS